MLLAETILSIDYGQVLVHLEGHPAPERLWTDAHVAQGFAWSEGAVSFGIPDHDGLCRLRVTHADAALLDPQALWALQVPFEVSGPLELGTLFQTERLAVPHGTHALVFAALPGAGGAGADEEEAYLLQLVFVRDDAPTFRILKQGGDLTTDEILCTGSEQA